MQKRSVKEAISSSKPSLTITIVENRYEIKNIYLGAGSFGEVCACWDQTTSEVLAVKTISKAKLLERINKSKFKERTKEFYVKCLRDEALILEKINHPNIIRFNGYSQTKSHLYFFLEYCNQGSLQTRIKRDGPLSYELAVPIMRQIVSALIFLHSQNICHRDIKPHNILLHNGSAKLSDFGFAINLSEMDKNMCQYVVGTDEYIAPEALMESRFTLKSDVWSLGVTFYRMVTGKNPWVFCGDQKEWLKRLTHAPAIVCPVPLWVKTAIGKMLTFSEELRPSLEEIKHFFQY